MGGGRVPHGRVLAEGLFSRSLCTGEARQSEQKRPQTWPNSSRRFSGDSLRDCDPPRTLGVVSISQNQMSTGKIRSSFWEDFFQLVVFLT